MVIDPLKESPFFLDEVSFALGEIENGYLVSKPLQILDIADFVGRIGSSATTLVVGASRTTVLTTYAI